MRPESSSLDRMLPGAAVLALVAAFVGGLMVSPARAESSGAESPHTESHCSNPDRGEVQDVEIVCLDASPLADMEAEELPVKRPRRDDVPTQTAQSHSVATDQVQAEIFAAPPADAIEVEEIELEALPEAIEVEELPAELLRRDDVPAQTAESLPGAPESPQTEDSAAPLIGQLEEIALEALPEAIEVEALPAELLRRDDVPVQTAQSPTEDSDPEMTEVISVPLADLPIDDQAQSAIAVPGEQLALRYETEQQPEVRESLAQAAVEEPPVDAVYHIGPLDGLSIVVWRNAELSTSVTVRPDGRISVPLIEDLYVAGQTPSEVARELENRLGEFIQDPLVTVIVSGFSGTYRQQIRVVGSATEPASIPYRENMRILDVMIAVGGLSPYGDGNGAMILRGLGQDRRQIPLRLDDLLDDGDSSANIQVAPGDIVVIPEGFFDGDWRFTQGASFTQTFSDNIDRSPSGSEEMSLVTEVGPTWTLSVDTARINTALTSSTQVRQQFLHDEGTSIRGNVNAASTVELFDDFLFFDASATSSRQTLDTTSSGADSDQSQVTSVSFSPYITNRFGSFADQQLRLTLSQTIIDSSGVSDDGTARVNYSLQSGRDFGKLGWILSASANQTERSESDSLIEANVSFAPSYQVTRTFTVTGSAGFQTRDDGDNANDISDPTWDVGFNWRPSRRTNVALSYGQRDAEQSVSANATYEITPRTSVALSYSEELDTAQERLEDNLAAIAIDPETGELIDSNSNQPFVQNTNPFSIVDESTRTRRLNVSFSHTKRRDTFSASIRAEDSRSNGDVDQRSFAASASWSRQINPRTTFSVSGSLRNASFDDGDRTDTDLNFDTNLTHRIYTDVSGFVSYSHARRFSDLVLDEFVENTVQAGVSLSF